MPGISVFYFPTLRENSSYQEKNLSFFNFCQTANLSLQKCLLCGVYLYYTALLTWGRAGIWRTVQCLRYMLDYPVFESRQGQHIFLSSLPWGPASLLFNVYRGSFQGVKWPGNEVGLSPPSVAKVKIECSHNCAPPISVQVAGREKVTFQFHC